MDGKDYEGVKFKTFKEAYDALYKDSIQIIEGREVYILGRFVEFVITEHPENYSESEWREMEA